MNEGLKKLRNQITCSSGAVQPEASSTTSRVGSPEEGREIICTHYKDTLCKDFYTKIKGCKTGMVTDAFCFVTCLPGSVSKSLRPEKHIKTIHQ